MTIQGPRYFLCYFYRLQTKLREGNVFTSFCYSVHVGGGCFGPGVPGPGGYLVLGGTWSWGGLVPGGLVQGGCAPGGWGVWYWGVSGSGGCLVLGGACSWGVPGGGPPRTATAAGGTYPTGMHSCY